MSIVEVRIANRYKLNSHIGKGLFSEVFEGENVYTGEKVAIKLEDKKIRYPQVSFEAQILKHLQGGLGIPLPYWCGEEGDYTCLVMELLGQTMADYKKVCGGKFSLKTVLMIADQMISIMEFIHSETIIHRDLKLENILMGHENTFFQVHLIDFGLSKRFIDPATSKHIPLKSGKTLLGSLEYASINNHNGKELSRRDDLESLAYILIGLYLGDLPWSGLATDEKAHEHDQKICAMKSRLLETETARKIPAELRAFLETVKRLEFDEEPKYTDYRRAFKELMIREGFSFDYIYDWILVPVANQVAKRMNAIDGLLQIDDTLTKEEETEIARLLEKYESDPTIIDFRLEEIRKQNKKFDIISPAGSPRTSGIEEKKGDKANPKDAGSKKNATKPGKKDRDCNLI